MGKKSKTYKKARIVHTETLSEELINNMQRIFNRTADVMNYIFNNMDTPKIIDIHLEQPRYVRDTLFNQHHNIGTPSNPHLIRLKESFGLNVRHVNGILRYTMANIITKHTNNVQRVKSAIWRNHNFTQEEKQYASFIIQYGLIMYVLLNKDIPQELKEGKYYNKKGELSKRKSADKLNMMMLEDKVNIAQIHKYIKKTYKRLSKTKGHTDKREFTWFAKDDYTHVVGEGIKLSHYGNRGRLMYPLKTKTKIKGGIFVRLVGNKLEIHTVSDHRVKNAEWFSYDVKGNLNNNKIGIDKGYLTALTTSNGNEYGKGLKLLIDKKEERITKLERNKNRFRDMYGKAVACKDRRKAKRILKNNLGNKQELSRRKKEDIVIKEYVNKAINDFMVKEKPTEVVIEKLNFVGGKGKIKSSKVRNRLNQWVQGYIDDRIVYKSISNGIKVTYINAAYTSQECSICGCLGKRDGLVFKCNNPNCMGDLHADKNAAKVILNRSNNSSIKLGHSARSVKKILEAYSKEAYSKEAYSKK